MLLRDLYETSVKDVAIIFGRFNPPHIGHKRAWQLGEQFDAWHVGINPKTLGEKNPLPFESKVEVMESLLPGVKEHVIAESTWWTLAARIYEMYGNVNLHIITDETDAKKYVPGLQSSNGKAQQHGYFNFKSIVWEQADRISEASLLREAVIKRDKIAFSEYAGIDANTNINGRTYYDIVSEHLLPFYEASYEGNLGLFELMKFYKEAGETNPELVEKVKELINRGEDKKVWRIVQDFTKTELVGKEFHESILDMIQNASSALRGSNGRT